MNDTATATPTLTRKVGQRVLITGGRFHGAARITKVNPKNILITLEQGGRVNSHPSFLSDLAEDAEVPSRYAVVTQVDLPTQNPGDVVRIKGEQGLFIVLADKFDKINVALLGGDRGRYIRAPRNLVSPLTAEEVKTLLSAL